MPNILQLMGRKLKDMRREFFVIDLVPWHPPAKQVAMISSEVEVETDPNGGSGLDVHQVGDNATDGQGHGQGVGLG